MPARIAPVSVARSTTCVAPARRAYQSASARISRPSASGFVTSTVRPAAVVITSDGRTAAHVALLAHDVRLLLEEIAAGVEGDRLADEREQRPLRRPRRLVAQDDELRRCRAR